MKTRIGVVLLFPLILLVALVQASVLPHWNILGTHPLWLPVICVFASVKGNAKWSLLYGFLAGMTMDVIIPGADGYYTATLLLCCYFLGKLLERSLSRHLASAFLASLCVLLVSQFGYILLTQVIPARAPLGLSLQTMLIEVVFSAISGLILYPIVALFTRTPTRKEGK
jgi:rod shape-determining protein MreD